MTDQPTTTTTTTDRRPAGPHPLAEVTEPRARPAEGDAGAQCPGQGVARACAPGPTGEDGGPEIAAAPVSPPSAGMYFGGYADGRLRRALARLRKRPDPAVHVVADDIAAEAAAVLLALAERAVQADPVLRRRREQATARTARMRAQLDQAIAAREARRASR